MTNFPSRSKLRIVSFALEAILATFFVGVPSAYSQGTGVYAKFLRNPDLVNVAYGPDSRNVLDLWKAPSPMATPLVIYIHGGGFSSGSKERLSPILLKRCLEKGISVGAINYRLSNTSPYPAAMHDGARAVQFFRAKSAEWNLDPNAIGATGGSAGGTLSLWLCFHEDLADLQSTDPVARQSTRLAAAATQSAPTTLVPSRMEKIAGTLASQHPFMEPFVGAKMSEWNNPTVQQQFEDASPDTHLSKDDPPAFLYHSGPWKLPDNPNAGQAIHATAFGVHLKEKADKIGARVSIRQIDEYPVKAEWEDALANEMAEFFMLAFRQARAQ
jgi:acetyl esterase